MPVRRFYVSLIRGAGKSRKVGLLAGPFDTHDAALGMVDRARQEASKVDPWTDFDAVGTMSIEGYDKPGALNSRLGL